jgi:hypothetical protein
MSFLITLHVLLRAVLGDGAGLAAENLALRQQLGVLRRGVKRPRLRRRDRVFWAWLCRLWEEWRSSLVIVQPETVVRWHRQGFGLYWRWESRRRGADRPALGTGVRALIRRMCVANPTWGAPRIHGELLKLGIDVAETTVAKYMRRRGRPSSPTWRAFLDNHVRDLVSIDFFTVPTASFRVLFVLVVLAHDRRRIVHLNVTDNPSAAWTGQQIRVHHRYERRAA